MENKKYEFPSQFFLDWDEVNPKFNWRAFDQDGRLFYYVSRPQMIDDAWVSILGHLFISRVKEKWSAKNWRDSLEQRP